MTVVQTSKSIKAFETVTIRIMQEVDNVFSGGGGF